MTLKEFLSEWNNDASTVLVHTSGSTGKPKPMRVEKARMMNSARITCNFLGLKADDTVLLCMPLDYIAGKMVVVRSLERGMRLINEKPCGHPLSRQALIDAAGELPHIDFAAMVPMQVYNSLQVPDERERLMEIGDLIIGGGAIDEEMEQALSAFPNRVWSTYGMTETLSHIALRRLNGTEASPWYTPFESVSISLNSDGCLVIDAPLVHDGVLVTNDRAEISHNRFRILGRKDNVIDSGGIKIQTEEVESKLKQVLTQPFVITKLPDKRFGEAVVLLTEDTDLKTVETLCRQTLPKFRQPKHYLHVDAIPLTETGKPARKQAEELAKLTINKNRLK